jgi:hypothetical protein
MSWENTTTEHDMDAASLQVLRGMRSDKGDIEPDLAVDGLSESIFSRLLGILTLGKL